MSVLIISRWHSTRIALTHWQVLAGARSDRQHGWVPTKSRALSVRMSRGRATGSRLPGDLAAGRITLVFTGATRE
jgi:hypothetical protein